LNHASLESRAKRLTDVVGAGLGLLLALPAMAAIAAAIRVTMGRPVIFRQERLGLLNRRIEIAKFRTMRPPRETENPYFSDRMRTTSLGAFLRKASLDELPQLWAVIRGDLSLVGPRPLVPEYARFLQAHFPERETVKPGITGLAQVSGRQSLSKRQRLELDVEYVRAWSLRGDYQLLARTMWIVLSRRGARTGHDIAAVDDIGLTGLLREAGGSTGDDG
jgi:sugar transferase EpsL